MKPSRKTTAFLVLCALIPWTAQAQQTLADHLPANGEPLDLYIAQDIFMAAAPYSATALINHPLTEHITVTDAALRAKTLERLRTVRITPDTDGRTWSCTDPHNPFGLWMLSNDTMLVLSPTLTDLKHAKKDDYSSACLQIGDTSLWLKLSNADLWQTIKPLLKK